MTPGRLFGLALVAWVVVVGLALALGPALTGDECAYALLARGVDAEWLYRPRGMIAMAEIGVALGGSDLAMRLTSAITSLGFLVAVAAVGRRAFSPWTGAWSAVLVVSSHAFVLRAPELLGDLPAATCLLAGVAVILGELARAGGPRYRLLAAAPALAAGFYFRYGSGPVIVMILSAAGLAWGRAAAARPGPVLATLALFAVLLVPFAWLSYATTGSVLGILELSRQVAGRGGMASGLHVFVLGNPFASYGALLPPVLLAGLIAIARPPAAPARRGALFLGAIAVGQVLVIGVVGQGPGNTRYIFFAVALLVMLGVDGVTRWSGSRARVVAWVTGGLAVVAWAVLAGLQPMIQARVAGHLVEVLADARAIRADAAGRPCVVAALAVPELMWYSGCEGVKLWGPGVPVALPAGRRWYGASTPGRPVDPAVLGAQQQAEAVRVEGAPDAWWLRPR